MNFQDVIRLRWKEHDQLSLRELVDKYVGPYGKARTDLQFLDEDKRHYQFLCEKYKEATKGEVHKSNCGCITLNGTLIEWCGEHYL